MKADTKLLEDMARMAGGALNVASGLRQQIHDDVRARIDEALSRMDVVPREDFDRLEAMLKQARLEQEDLKKRLEALEKDT